jgi:serine/threonine protein kinase
MTDATLESQWPAEVLEQYEAVKFLGSGRFGSVVLAKSKGDNQLVAIKQVEANTNTQTHYAHREMYILKELNHPNIVKLIDSWEPHDNTKSACMALSYAKGNTLHYVLKHFGAPSFTFSRVVIAQLVDAVSHLHSVSKKKHVC